jgi:hypothetical protein
MRPLILMVVLGVCAAAVTTRAVDEKQCKADPRGNAYGYSGRCGTASATVGVDGGTISTPTGVSVMFPFGAVDGPTGITIETSPTPAPHDALSSLYQFGPEGMVFARPVTVSLPMPPGVTNASIYFSKLGAPGEFEPIGGTIANGFITAQTPHFSSAYVGSPSSLRTVNGVGGTTWISATSRQTVLQDFTAIPADAFIVDAGGNIVSTIPATPGTGAAIGTFTIDNVPNGQYILHSGNRYMVTSTNAPDLGGSRGGRPNLIPLGNNSTFLNFHLTNLESWHPGDMLELFSTEADDWDFGTDRFGIPDALGNLNLNFDLRNAGGNNQISLIEGTKGDRLYFGQLSNATSPNGHPYIAMSRLVQFAPFNTVVGGTVNLTASMLNVQQLNTTAAEFHGDQFANLMFEANPHTASGPGCGACAGFFSVVGQGGTANDGFYTSNSDLLVVRDATYPVGSVVHTGTMTYGSPANAGLVGNWGEIGLVQWFGTVRYQLPGKTATQRGLASGMQLTAAASDFAAPHAIVPTLSFVRNIQIDGVNAFSDQNLASLTPLVSWDPPTVGTPTRYGISIVEVFANGAATQTRVVAQISTPNTAFRLPPGILQSGHFYAFQMFAWDAPAQGNAPFRTVLNAAFAATPTGLLTAP